MRIALLFYLLRQKNFGRKGTVLTGTSQISAVLLDNSVNAGKTETVSLTLGGLETMLMNYYRKIDRDKIQFDFLVHRNEEAYYDKEIQSLGGKIFHLPRLNPFSKSYKNALKNFLLNHPEYKIIHVHQDCLSGVILKVAKECGVPLRIAHSHNSNQDKNLKYLIKLYYKSVADGDITVS
jgi:hypothetical protein